MRDLVMVENILYLDKEGFSEFTASFRFKVSR